MMVGDLLYRYDDLWVSGGEVEVNLFTYRITKVTPHGVWIGSWADTCRFVRLAARKRYACPTKEEARQSFEARKMRQVKILRARLECAEIALGIAKNLPTHEGTLRGTEVY